MKKVKPHFIAIIFLLFYIYIFLITEILSFFSLLYRPITIAFNTVFIFLLMYSYRKSIKDSVFGIKKLIKGGSIKFILVILLLAFVQGLMSAPSTTDAMVYHLPRVMYWNQEHTVFQDVIKNKHDFMAPFADYLLFHFYNLTGNDRLVFMSQWLAFVGSIVLTALITLQLGGKAKTAVRTSLLAALLPIAVMQSVSTQIDMVSTVLVLEAIYLALLMRQKITLPRALLLGFAIGLGFMAKAPSIFFMLPAFGIILIALVQKRFRGFAYLFFGGVLAVLIQLRYFFQNFRLFGNIFGKHLTFIEGEELILTNEKIGLGITLSNFIKNIMLHLPIPFFANYMQLAINKLHEVVDISVNSPLSTCCQTEFKVQSIIFPQEDIVANPVHLILIIFTGLVFFRKSFRKKHLYLFYLYLLLLGSMFIFGGVIKWQPFHSRFHIPFFVFGTILAVIVLEKIKWGMWVVKLSIIGSIMLGLFLVLFNVSRPYISYGFIYNSVKTYSPPLVAIPVSFFVKPREVQYFNARTYWYEPYHAITEKLWMTTNDDKIAIYLMDDFEYPLWRLLKYKKVKGQVLSQYQIDDADIILSTSKMPYRKEGFVTECVKTTIDYGYACLSVKKP